MQPTSSASSTGAARPAHPARRWPVAAGALVLVLAACNMRGPTPRVAAPAAGAAAQTPGWLTLAPMGEPRQEVGVAELGGVVYVAGGFLGDGSASSTAEAYDVAGDSWRFVAALPQALHHPGAATLGGRVYVVGGYDDRGAVDSLWEYDPAADRW